jgi:excisionase family DNA binding protein
MVSSAEPLDTKLLLRISEAAIVLSCGRSTIYQLIGEQEIRTVKLGRSVRIPASSLKSFVERKLADQSA